MMNPEAHVSPILSNSFDPALYNALPPVVSADKTFSEKTDAGLFFESAAELVCRFDLEKYIGVCLLHNHNKLEDGEVMVESFEYLGDGRPALVMALTKSPESREIVPVVWKLQKVSGKHRFIPLEHATQEQAKVGYQRLVENQTFLSEFKSLLLEFDYQDIIGLTILRDDVLPKKADEHLVERIHAKRVANVVTAEQRTDETPDNFVVTNWFFVKRMANAGSECVKGVCESSRLCKTEQGDHVGVEFTHEAPCVEFNDEKKQGEAEGKLET